ncbi:methylthioribose kinase [Ameyamaea chiangmaiensis NBRC 103196]|uniref:S-methyl-5-thioribose kinase n=1 Tax=Ameyamaea chiangmaiensis TaxID=442969 RepID=A0A850PHJ4_9PROT|nr:S-methyl-5-thioribose kinase [Ameyamaea chiangmaiensis]MBS4076415.1 S-methyl-5-thioribose kinase [Ameyamaea chiangmaiensis]NVN41880.1 S-methyl-5-thioribose kinase [Ameyamaea chiangmaiensis]GBQ61798.1 methylthioribose kinase [Ameyamaea chiangmaiensis NBRC 103196]
MIHHTAYRTLARTDVAPYLAEVPSLTHLLGGRAADWSVREVSDGNLNMVWIVEGPARAVCVKQSLPHVRVDPAWSMPLDRTAFEAAYLREVEPLVPDLIARPLHFDPVQFVLVTEALRPHRVVRGMLIDGIVPTGLGAAIGRYVATTGIGTSLLAAPFETMMGRIATFAANTTLTRITVDLVMTDPFRAHPRNRPMRPELEALEWDLSCDRALAAAVARLRARFLGTPQALLHGDLHTGSIMAHDGDIRVIDGEFALCGPVGFDAGMFLANLLLSGFANPHTDGAMDEIAPFWTTFVAQAQTLWQALETAGGDVYDAWALSHADERAVPCAAWRAEIWRDMLGFCGLEMIRRTIGYAQVADYAVAPDRAREAARRHRAVTFARRLLTVPEALPSVTWLLDAAQDARREPV